MSMNWIPVTQALPKPNQAVLVRRGRDNWGCDHTLSDGKTQKVWRWQACRFVQGRTQEEVKASGVSRMGDQDGNNLVPYCWDEFGPGCLFGQEVTHWAAIEPTEED